MQSRAMVLDQRRSPLRERFRDVPLPGPGEVRLRVRACGVCRTDLHVVDGELTQPHLPLVPGHEVVGVVEERGEGVTALRLGQRVGVPWLGGTCGVCRFCLRGDENLCETPRFTGYTADGGYAEHIVARADFCFPLPDAFDDVHAAPLLCAGLIGWRSYRRIPAHAQRLGLFGFGAAAHLIAQIAVADGKEVYAFTRGGDLEAQRLARELGATWAGGSDDDPPALLDAAILFAPVGALVPRALALTDKGGVVVCGGIHMSDIPSFPYALLWGERVVRSVANLTRDDGRTFFHRIATLPLRVETRAYPLARANDALDDLRAGRVQGAAVLVP